MSDKALAVGNLIRTPIPPAASALPLTLLALTTEAERAIKLLRERRTALISAAVTGKIDVRNLSPKEAK